MEFGQEVVLWLKIMMIELGPQPSVLSGVSLGSSVTKAAVGISGVTLSGLNTKLGSL